MPLLSEDEVDGRLQDGPWRREGDSLVRDLVFGDFAEALAFVNRVGAAAEHIDHHPDILLHGYREVRLTLTTHSEGGITEADLALASTLNGFVDA
jgi:4a-hydroxytetrahydrobiopterin dehydratase